MPIDPGYQSYDTGFAGAVASQEYSFMSPKSAELASLPLRLAVIGDPGTTYNTSTTLQRMLALDPAPDVVVLAGCVVCLCVLCLCVCAFVCRVFLCVCVCVPRRAAVTAA